MYFPHKLAILFNTISLISVVKSQSYNDVICRRPWYFSSPRPAPLIISVILLVLLILLCCCCCISWLVVGRKKKSKSNVEAEKKTTTTKKDSQIQTISSSTIDSGTQWELRREETEKRRSYAAARDRELDYQYFS
uniref:G_PROTEIN_RECEP_F1_2 domain-containing protein n=1 Tax=Caenorhabditis tropicalis TaxID=1561998 RepID=A0A1I7UHP1_9PELO